VLWIDCLLWGGATFKENVVKKNRELYLRYRPKKLSKVLGQDDMVYSLEGMAKKDKIPHDILFTGPSGCGKTTIARIIAKLVGCEGRDLEEINAAVDRGIETVREIRSVIGLSPIIGKSKGWIIDECHQMTTQAQESFLKMLEDTPDWAYFFLCTTEPQKLIPTIRTRCTDIKVKSLDSETMEKLLYSVCKKERIKLDDKVQERLIQVADGSARKALVLLHQVQGMKDKKKQIKVIQESDLEAPAIEIARALIRQGVTWKEVAKLLKEVPDEPESIRRMILGYANSIALNGGGPILGKAMVLIDCFSSHYYDCGKAGLTWSCYQAISVFSKRGK